MKSETNRKPMTQAELQLLQTQMAEQFRNRVVKGIPLVVRESKDQTDKQTNYLLDLLELKRALQGISPEREFGSGLRFKTERTKRLIPKLEDLRENLLQSPELDLEKRRELWVSTGREVLDGYISLGMQPVFLLISGLNTHIWGNELKSLAARAKEALLFARSLNDLEGDKKRFFTDIDSEKLSALYEKLADLGIVGYQDASLLFNEMNKYVDKLNMDKGERYLFDASKEFILRNWPKAKSDSLEERGIRG